MVDKITADRIVEVTYGYAIEFELPNGEPTRLVGKCKEALIKTAHALYTSKQAPTNGDNNNQDDRT